MRLRCSSGPAGFHHLHAPDSFVLLARSASKHARAGDQAAGRPSSQNFRQMRRQGLRAKRLEPSRVSCSRPDRPAGGGRSIGSPCVFVHACSIFAVFHRSYSGRPRNFDRQKIGSPERMRASTSEHRHCVCHSSSIGQIHHYISPKQSVNIDMHTKFRSAVRQCSQARLYSPIKVSKKETAPLAVHLAHLDAVLEVL